MALPGLEQCKVRQRLQACKWHDVIKDWPDPYKRIPKAIHMVEASQGIMVDLLVSSDEESKDCVCVCACVCARACTHACMCVCSFCAVDHIIMTEKVVTWYKFSGKWSTWQSGHHPTQQHRPEVNSHCSPL